MTCGDSDPVEIPAGASCTVTANLDGSATITCEDGTSVDIGRPGPPTDEPVLELLAGVTSVGSNDGLATETRMDGALHAAFSPDGNFLYFVDSFNGTIRRFGLVSGRVVTLAGRAGEEGVTDGLGSEALFENPRGITIHPDGSTLYIADGFNCTLRTLDTATREVRTLFGVPRECGYVDGDYEEARMGLVIGMAMQDDRYVYLAQRANGANAIRRIDLEEQRVETIAGSAARGHADGPGAEAEFAGPGGIDFDETGEWLWVNDTFNNVIRRISLTEVDGDGEHTFRVETVAGTPGAGGHVDGDGPDARLAISQGLTRGVDGFYVAGFHDTIRRIAPEAPFTVTTVAGRNGQSGSADGHPFEARFGVAFGIHAHPDGERIYFMDRGNNNIREYNLTVGRVTTVMGAPQPTDWRDGDGMHARFRTPAGVLPDSAGRFVYIADQFNSVVRRYDTATRTVETLAGLPRAFGFQDGTADDALFDEPSALALNADETVLWISDIDNRAIRALDLETLEVTTVTGGPDRIVEFEAGEPVAGTVIEGALADVHWGRITGLAFDAATNRVFASDYSLDLIRVLDLETGTVSTLAGGAQPPLVEEVDEDGNPVLDEDGNPVLVVADEYEVDGTGDEAILDSPYGLALSADGGTLYFADFFHHLIRQVDTTTGEVTTIAGEYGVSGAFDDIGLDAAFTRPRSVGLSADGQRLFVVDGGNHAVRQIDLDTREVTTVVGELGISGGFGFRFTPLDIARLYFPGNLAVDGDDILLTARNVLYRVPGLAAAP
ncbi:MAG: hypothetical protein EA398_04930 [Deltaproteobacteria bacterium]|nr:MAG: hypothetical protein EA398_04930 [Deltaproteobacteria bacterium]